MPAYPRTVARSRTALPRRLRLVSNHEIAAALDELADGLEIEGANPFRVRAYRNGARTLEGLARPVAELARDGGAEALTELPGIGDSLAAKIVEMLETGALHQLAELRRAVPPELSALLGIPGLGPKRLRLLHQRLGIRDLGDLEKAIERGRLLELEGFGPRSVAKLARGVTLFRRRSGRFLLVEAESIADALRRHLAAVPGVQRVEVAGSYRRRKETVGDLDLLVSSNRPAAAVRAFTRFDAVAEVTARGRTRAAVRLRNGLQVDLRVVEDAVFGAALLYFTGSKEHTVALRTLARERGLKISEYGAFRGARRLAARREAEIYGLLGLAYVEPELRENRGEIELARQGRLPELITLADLRGDLQMHTTATDGRNSIEEMARAARELGRSYIAITEHSRAVRVAGGLDDRALLAHAGKIRAARMPGLRLLAGVEVDILKDGSLDLADETLAALDIVVASVHSALELSRDAMTRRVIRAVESGLVHVLGHPTGRLLGEREPYEIDLEAVIASCVAHGVALEVNAHPHRLDLDGVHARMAREMGAKIVSSTDAHSTGDLALLRFGIDVARRAGLEASYVLNTFPAAELLRRLGKKRLH